LVALLVVCSGAQRELYAQEEPSPEQLYDQAVRLAEDGKFSESIAIWAAIQDDLKEPEDRLAVLANLGFAHLELENLVEAWYFLQRNVDLSPQATPEIVVELRDLEKRLLDKHFRVALSCEPTGAKVYWGEDESGGAYPCPLIWWFEPGQYRVLVKRDGYESKADLITVPETGEKSKHTVELRPLRGVLEIQGGGGAEGSVHIDGQLEGSVPYRGEWPVGSYEVVVRHSEQTVLRREIEIVANRDLLLQVEKAAPPVPAPGNILTEPVAAAGHLQEPPTSSLKWPWVLVGAGLATVAGGGVCNLTGYVRNADLKAKYETGDVEYDRKFDDQVKPLRNLSYVMYGVGGAAAIGGLAWALWRDVPAAEHLSAEFLIAPLVAPASIGVEMGLAF